jgi:hypothetical protein
MIKIPTNLDILLILLRAYDSLKDGNNFMYHLSQFRALADGIKVPETENLKNGLSGQFGGR